MRPRRLSVRVLRDRARLLSSAEAARDHVLHAVERATARVRAAVTVHHQGGKLVIVTAAGWRLGVCRLGERIALNIQRGPRLDHGRRAALSAAHNVHELEADLWLAWALTVTTSTGPSWPALDDFMRAPSARKAS